MSQKTYLPKFVQTLHYLGKYAYKHKPTLYAAIDSAEKLTLEEKQAARKAVDEFWPRMRSSGRSGWTMQIPGTKVIGLPES